METLGRVRKPIAVGAVLLGFFTFFLPMVTVKAPIVGELQWSALNIVSQALGEKQDHPSLRKLTDSAIEQETSVHTPDTETQERSLPLGLLLAPLIPLELAATYLFLLLAAAALCSQRLQEAFGIIAGAGLAFGSIAMVSVFLFADAVQRSMTEAMNGPEMADNPFAGFGRLLVQSVRVGPGIALYVLIAAMGCLLLIWKLRGLDHLTFEQERSRGAAS